MDRHDATHSCVDFEVRWQSEATGVMCARTMAMSAVADTVGAVADASSSSHSPAATAAAVASTTHAADSSASSLAAPAGPRLPTMPVELAYGLHYKQYPLYMCVIGFNDALMCTLVCTLMYRQQHTVGG